MKRIIGIPYGAPEIDEETGKVSVVCPVCGEKFDPCVEHTDPRSYSVHYVEEHGD